MPGGVAGTGPSGGAGPSDAKRFGRERYRRPPPPFWTETVGRGGKFPRTAGPPRNAAIPGLAAVRGPALHRRRAWRPKVRAPTHVSRTGPRRADVPPDTDPAKPARGSGRWQPPTAAALAGGGLRLLGLRRGPPGGPWSTARRTPPRSNRNWRPPPRNATNSPSSTRRPSPIASTSPPSSGAIAADRDAALAQIAQNEHQAAKLQAGPRHRQPPLGEPLRRAGASCRPATSACSATWAARGSPLGAGATRRFEELAAKYPDFDFDPVTGVSKFGPERDVRERPGGAEPQRRPPCCGSSRRSWPPPRRRALNVLIVGHTDDERIAGAGTRAKHPTNWHLSTDRANEVAVTLAAAGLPESRMGVAGYSKYQPQTANRDELAKAKNRRVEIYVLAPRGQSRRRQFPDPAVNAVAAPRPGRPPHTADPHPRPGPSEGPGRCRSCYRGEHYGTSASKSINSPPGPRQQVAKHFGTKGLRGRIARIRPRGSAWKPPEVSPPSWAGSTGCERSSRTSSGFVHGTSRRASTIISVFERPSRTSRYPDPLKSSVADLGPRRPKAVFRGGLIADRREVRGERPDPVVGGVRVRRHAGLRDLPVRFAVPGLRLVVSLVESRLVEERQQFDGASCAPRRSPRSPPAGSGRRRRGSCAWRGRSF